ncbi:hypothetical protein Taro_012659 [Colocasia esculenta]|uniref:Peptidase A1 domain-containing protein n=1 Tax=Colocasia esculenta TaxID=4460 RepID=A0A843U9N8_COLES|nr:hypothetical protein [Colocasia esculenta]
MQKGSVTAEEKRGEACGLEGEAFLQQKKRREEEEERGGSCSPPWGCLHSATASLQVATDPVFFSVKTTPFQLDSVALRNAFHGKNSLKVVHRLGPCSPSGKGQLSDDEILGQDAERVAYFQKVVKKAANLSGDPVEGSLDVTLPARSGATVGSPSYVVTIGLGTPRVEQTVVFDSGSSLCWVQCKSCQSCYRQKEPIFDPGLSSTYRKVRCNEEACTRLEPNERGCTNNTCTYNTVYADSSTTSGVLSLDKLSLPTPPNEFASFVFGCGNKNKGLFKGAAGLFGLGRGYHSLATQVSGTHGKVFSYCLPSKDTVGHLTFGRPLARSPSYTPLGNTNDPNVYLIELIGFSVGHIRMPIRPAIFQRGAIIDSGTVVTHLPQAAYAVLRNAFRVEMERHRYRLARPVNILDTCYLINRSNFSYPPITLHFRGKDGDAVSLIGSTQQAGSEVIYDNVQHRIGFAPGTCS